MGKQKQRKFPEQKANAGNGNHRTKRRQQRVNGKQGLGTVRIIDLVLRCADVDRAIDQLDALPGKELSDNG